jgi:hypothetical protein
MISSGKKIPTVLLPAELRFAQTVTGNNLPWQLVCTEFIHRYIHRLTIFISRELKDWHVNFQEVCAFAHAGFWQGHREPSFLLDNNSFNAEIIIIREEAIVLKVPGPGF